MSVAKADDDYVTAWPAVGKAEGDEFERAFEALPPTADERRAAVEVIKVADASGRLPREGALKAMSHAELYQLRDKYRPDDKEAHNLIAPYEHRAFAREAVAENPALAVPIAAAVPLYEAAKLIGTTGGRSAPSLESMRQGFIGVGEGVSKAISGK